MNHPHFRNHCKIKVSDNVMFWGIVAIALCVRLIYLFQIRGNPFWVPYSMDPHLYHRWAVSLVTKGWMGDSVFNGLPVYPYFLGLIYAVFGINVFIARFIQMVIGALSCGLTFILGRKFFSARIAFTAGLITALYKPFIFYDGILVGANLTIFLYLINMLLAHKFITNPSKRIGWIWGIQTGLAGLCRPPIILFPIVAIFFFMREQKSKLYRRKYLSAVICVFIGLSILFGVVLLRNYTVAKDWILTTHGGLNLYIGNNPSATGKFHAPKGVGRQPETMLLNAHRIAEQKLGRMLKPSESSRYWKHKAYAFIIHNPSSFLRLIGKKIYLFWQGGEISDFRNIEFFQRYSMILRFPLFTFFIIIPWSIMGIFLSLKSRKGILLHYFLWPYFLSILIFFINSRYRLPVIPVLCLFASNTFFYLLDIVRLNRKKFLIFASMLCVLYVMIGYRMEKPCLADDYNELAVWYITRNKDVKRAIALYREAYKLDARNQYVVFNIAKLYFDLHNYKEALNFFRKAVSIDKNDFESYNFIGIILSRLGKNEEALSYFKKAIQVNNGYFKAYNNCALNFVILQQYTSAAKMWKQSLIIQPNQSVVRKRLLELKATHHIR